MASVHDVANFFIELGQAHSVCGCGDPVTNLQLQKLLYFAQGWYLAKFGKPLFDDDFRAWQYGPVIPDMYHKYKNYGSNGIMREGIPSAADHLLSDEYDLLLDVAQEYMQYSASGLVALTHQKGTPWDHAAPDSVIPKCEIQKYFAASDPLPSFDGILDEYPVEVL